MGDGLEGDGGRLEGGGVIISSLQEGLTAYPVHTSSCYCIKFFTPEKSFVGYTPGQGGTK